MDGAERYTHRENSNASAQVARRGARRQPSAVAAPCRIRARVQRFRCSTARYRPALASVPFPAETRPPVETRSPSKNEDLLAFHHETGMVLFVSSPVRIACVPTAAESLQPQKTTSASLSCSALPAVVLHGGAPLRQARSAPRFKRTIRRSHGILPKRGTRTLATLQWDDRLILLESARPRGMGVGRALVTLAATKSMLSLQSRAKTLGFSTRRGK